MRAINGPKNRGHFTGLHDICIPRSRYDWPFDLTHGKGAQNVDVLDIHGKPHAEQCDPGIYPSFFLDHGRPAGQAAFLDIFRKYIQGGDTADGEFTSNLLLPWIYPALADPRSGSSGRLSLLVIARPFLADRLRVVTGVYLDCFDQMPLTCKGGTCVAIRNKNGNNASIVSQASVTNYIAGKKAGQVNSTFCLCRLSPLCVCFPVHVFWHTIAMKIKESTKPRVMCRAKYT